VTVTDWPAKRISREISLVAWSIGGFEETTMTRLSNRSILPVLAAVIGVIVMAGLAGCGGQPLVHTPYLMYGESGAKVYESVHPGLRTPDIPVIYVTDRLADRVGPNGPEYGYNRSRRVTYGVATVSLTPEPTWEQLVADSTSAKRSADYRLRVTSVEERGGIEPVIRYLEARGGRLARKPGALDAFSEDVAPFDALLDDWLARTPRKAVVLFVHGFNNTFEDAVIRLAQAWHFGGRQGVPIVYTWPAGSGGLLRGYTYDRESGEFTIVHLKLLLRTLALHEGVEKIHIISHSRGTDVVTTALREVNAEIRGLLRVSTAVPLCMPGEKPVEMEQAPLPWTILKIETLVLAAPDLDLDVFSERFFGENLMGIANRVVVYFSAEDEALGLANWLFRSQRRLGALRLEDVPEESRRLLSQLTSLEAINCRVSGFTTHAYAFRHPAALSDLLLVLREGKAPGAENGRPLAQPVQGIWELDNDYLKPE
jgi:esterase/lipase superfamily enzyme